jgi:2-methylisocitrate lyase-like PEP mutase family enzyme
VVDPDVVVLARTDARAAVGGGLDEVLRRCEAYGRTEVDILMVSSLKNSAAATSPWIEPVATATSITLPIEADRYTLTAQQVQDLASSCEQGGLRCRRGEADADFGSSTTS